MQALPAPGDAGGGVAGSAPQMIALDWGSTHLRASLLGAAGQVLATRQSADGVMAVPPGGFESVLTGVCGHWMETHKGIPMLACGMVGSRQGWCEAPYLPTPAGPSQAAAALTVIGLGTQALSILPGVSSQPRPGRFDVMRGEETQVWGCRLAGPPDAFAWCLLPGTHSKWVRVDGQGRVCALHTYMTGELYALLCQHGTPGRLMVHGRPDAAAFAAGVALGAAEHAQATHAMFAARTAGLLGGVAADALPDYLSGVLIGAEIASARAQLTAADRVQPLRVIGSDALCTRYHQALQQLNVRAAIEPPGATERGLWRVALAAGLVRPSTGAQT